MRTGSAASASAVFTSTASAPISMHAAASLGTPRPASTTTGTDASSTMISMLARVRMPRPAPIATRRMLTVTISAPLAAIASRMTSKLLYLPVPTMRRESKERPPITRRSSDTSTSLHHADDLHHIVLFEWHVGNPALLVDVA